MREPFSFLRYELKSNASRRTGFDIAVYRDGQLIDQVMLDHRAPELIARGDDDLSVQLLLQPPDLLHRITVEDRRVVPLWLYERG